jgi:hypothetical protein
MERLHDEYIRKLKVFQEPGTDIEIGHSYGDELLCDLLIELGYKDVVEEWRKIEKWYA